MMSEKECFKCHELKPLSEFYAHSRMLDGHLNKCKACTKKDVRDHRENNQQKLQQYEKKRSKHPRRIEQNRRNIKRYRKSNPEANLAHHIVNNAIRSGKLIKKPCDVCGTIKLVHAHHDDYSKPLDVRWLCATHHRAHHVKLLREKVIA